jgi:hypothetical protein
MISAHYATPVAILLSLAMIPTVIHSYLNLSVDNSASSKAIKADLGEFISVPTRRNAEWGASTFGCTDSFERTYKDKQGNSARLFVGRAYDHKRLYHHPELALSHGEDLRHNGQVNLAGNPQIPVHLLHHTVRPTMAAYVLYYDGHFVDNPIAQQVKNSLQLLVSPQKPMTLFYISEDNLDKQTAFDKTLSAKVLSEAIKRFLAQQPTDRPG